MATRTVPACIRCAICSSCRPHLGQGCRDAKVCDLLGVVLGEVDREQRAAALEHAQQAPVVRTADGVKHEVNVVGNIFGAVLGVVDEAVRAELAQELFVFA